MKYICIDIETLGLNIKSPIIQFAAVFVKNGEIVSEFETLVSNDAYHYCEPYAMSMHSDLLRRLAIDKSTPIQHLTNDFFDHMMGTGFDPYRPTVFAGKQVASFDIPRLNYHTKGYFSHRIAVDYRYLDPGSMFARSGDERVPSLEEILNKLGINLEVNHTALADARATVAAIEAGLGRV